MSTNQADVRAFLATPANDRGFCHALLNRLSAAGLIERDRFGRGVWVLSDNGHAVRRGMVSA